MSRLGDDVKIEISALPTEQYVDQFVEKILRFLRKADFDLLEATRAATESTGEAVDARFYPFSNDAIDAMKAKLGALTPRAITMQMTRALGRAYRRQLAGITTECVT